MVDFRGKWPLRGCSKPQIPADTGRNSGSGRTIRALAVLSSLHTNPRMHLANLSDCTLTNELDAKAVFGCRMNLVAHLRRHAGLFGLCTQLSSFPDGVGQGLLTVHMLASAHGRHGYRSVHVVRSRDDDGINATSKIRKQFTVVRPVPHAGKGSVSLIKATGVDVTETDKLHRRVTADVGEIGPAHAVDTDGCHIQLPVTDSGSKNRRCGSGRSQHGTRLLQKLTTAGGG